MDGKGARPSRPIATSKSLTLEIDQLLQHFVGGRDDAGVRLITALRDNHVRKLHPQVDVGHFQVAGRHGAAIPRPGSADVRHSRVRRFTEKRTGFFVQTAGISKGGESQLTQYLQQPVGK